MLVTRLYTLHSNKLPAVARSFLVGEELWLEKCFHRDKFRKGEFVRIHTYSDLNHNSNVELALFLAMYD